MKRIKQYLLVIETALFFLLPGCNEAKVSDFSSIESSPPEGTYQVEALTPSAENNVWCEYQGYLECGVNTPDYDIVVNYEADAEYPYITNIIFSFSYGDGQNQSFNYTVEHYPSVGSVHWGMHIIDMNGDNNEDIVIDLGTTGHMTKALCLVYDTEQVAFNFVKGFDQLNSPRLGISALGEIFIWEDSNPGSLSAMQGINKWTAYQVDGTNLVPMELGVDDMKEQVLLF